MKFALALALALAACSPAPETIAAAPLAAAPVGETDGMESGPRAVDRAMPGQDYRIAISEDAEARHFALELTSLSDRELCFGAADWPDERGRIEGAADFVSLQANGEGYAMRDRGEAECGAACVRRLAPRGVLQGSIGFDQFVPEAFDPPGPRTLVFDAGPFFCDTGEVE